MATNIPVSDRDFPGRDLEDEFFGKWFPRIGALAVVLGAGFGFKYAIDQGWVKPELRVILGLLLSSILIGIGDWTLKREWSSYAHAITGGGVGLLYLTLWAAVDMYQLIPPSVGFICLAGVSGLGCALALRHESQALALLAVTGGFMNPFITGAEMPHGLYLYVLAIDIAVVVLSFLRPWNILEKIAFVASWVVLEISGGSPKASLLAATGLFLLFGVLPYARVLLRKAQGQSDLALIPINALLFYFVVFARATGDMEPLRGPLTLGLAIFFIVGHLIVRGHEARDQVVGTSSGVLGLIFLTLWVPVQLGAELMAFGWAAEGLVLMGLALNQREVALKVGGWAVLLMSGAIQFVLLAESPATALGENFGRVVLMVLVAGTYVGAYVEHRYGSSEGRDGAVIGANLLTLFWLSAEVYAAAAGEIGVPEDQDLHFGLSGAWGLYAAALLGVGIFIRNRVVRMMSLGLFGVTVMKMALHDLWLLDTLQRLIGFVGIGVLLLACSLLYQRFREWILFEGTPKGGER